MSTTEPSVTSGITQAYAVTQTVVTSVVTSGISILQTTTSWNNSSVTSSPPPTNSLLTTIIGASVIGLIGVILIACLCKMCKGDDSKKDEDGGGILSPSLKVSVFSNPEKVSSQTKKAVGNAKPPNHPPNKTEPPEHPPNKTEPLEHPSNKTMFTWRTNMPNPCWNGYYNDQGLVHSGHGVCWSRMGSDRLEWVNEH